MKGTLFMFGELCLIYKACEIASEFGELCLIYKACEIASEFGEALFDL